MKRTILFLAGFIATACGNRTSAQEPLFPDPGLEAAVRAQVFEKRHNTQPLNAEDVAKISQIQGAGRKIANLAGLEHCKAVQLLDLGNNEIVDVSPIAGLTLLQSLTLSRNKIESIGPLKELARMQLLDLSENQLKDISPIAQMTNLRTLYLSKNKIEDIKLIGELPKIWTLYLDGNPVGDWSAVGKLKWLTSFNASSCEIEDLSFLKPLKRLSTTVLIDNHIKDLTPLIEMAEADQSQEFAQFWKLHLRGNEVSAAQVEKLKSLGAKVHLE